MGERALLLLEDEHALALTPDGEGLVVFDPETGDGAECCCGAQNALCVECVRDTITTGGCSIIGAQASDPTGRARRVRWSWSGTGTREDKLIRSSDGAIVTNRGAFSCSGFYELELGERADLGDAKFWIGGKVDDQYTHAIDPAQSYNVSVQYRDVVATDAQAWMGYFATAWGNELDVARFAWSLFLTNTPNWPGNYAIPTMFPYIENNTSALVEFRCNRTASVPADGLSVQRTGTNGCGGGNYRKVYNVTSKGGAFPAGMVIETATINWQYSCVIVTPCGGPRRTCADLQGLWLASDPAMDLNGDGFVDGIDLDEIVRRYCVGSGA